MKNFKEVFKKYPELEEVRWTAYTPYFNDGETCEYGSSHTSPDLLVTGCSYNGKEYKVIEKEIKEFLIQFDDELMYDLFGDHIEIIVTKEGISVNEYEHD